MPVPVICAYARTPVGKFRGSLSNYSAVDLGILAVKELLERAGINPGMGIVDQVYMGQVLQAGCGQAPARQVAIGSGMPVTTPCTTINKVCGSSLKAAMIAATEVRAGVSRVVVAGGMEITWVPAWWLLGTANSKLHRRCSSYVASWVCCALACLL